MTVNLNFNCAYYEAGSALLQSYVNTFTSSDSFDRKFRCSVKQRTEIYNYFIQELGLVSVNSSENYWFFRSNDPIKQLAVKVGWSNFEQNVYTIDPFSFEICATGRVEGLQIIERFQQKFDLVEMTKYSYLRSLWAYLKPNQELDYLSLSVQRISEFVPEMYPFIGDVDQFIQDFIESTSTILILLGDPGLGKSTFIKYLLAKTRWSSVLAYDESVMKIDSLYMNFLKGDNDVLILEDADVLLRSRLEDNKIMSKLLNVSNGILDTGNKKFIFTANIENARDLDPALVRPGRCFAVKMFRPLTLDEATIASEKIGKTIFTNKENFTVAEIYQGKDMKSNVKELAQGMGF